MQWQDFEIECTDYLNRKYGVTGEVRFVRMGSTNSTVSDIRVEVRGVEKFYVEAKMAASQCGQFVLHPDAQKQEFVFSERNSSTETPTSRKIIQHMNENFEKYVRGGVLEMDKQVFYDWVEEHYRGMGARYVITSHDDRHLIFPVEKLREYFDIGGKYRVKRSGSRSPSRKQQEQAIDLLRRAKAGLSYRVTSDGLIVKGDDLRQGERFEIDDNVYWLTDYGDGYRVRILSKTANSNVIFSISLKKRVQDPTDLSRFVADLR